MRRHPLRRRPSTVRHAHATLQPGMHMSVSPDDGNGGRMSYLRFEDQARWRSRLLRRRDQPGSVRRPLGLQRRRYCDARPGDRAHDQVPGQLQARPRQRRREGLHRQQEGRHRHDVGGLLPLRRGAARGRGNVVPSTSKLLFREGGAANPADNGKGFLVDNVSLSSSRDRRTTTFGERPALAGLAFLGGRVAQPRGAARSRRARRARERS